MGILKIIVFFSLNTIRLGPQLVKTMSKRDEGWDVYHIFGLYTENYLQLYLCWFCDSFFHFTNPAIDDMNVILIVNSNRKKLP